MAQYLYLNCLHHDVASPLLWLLAEQVPGQPPPPVLHPLRLVRGEAEGVPLHPEGGVDVLAGGGHAGTGALVWTLETVGNNEQYSRGDKEGYLNNFIVKIACCVSKYC